MKDIFDALIMCKQCNKEMYPSEVIKDGITIRAVQCQKCKDIIYHPADMERFKHFNNLRDKTFNVKLRVIGNSHAISIPKEIVEFMREQERMMDDMVKLCFEDMSRIRLDFGGQNGN